MSELNTGDTGIYYVSLVFSLFMNPVSKDKGWWSPLSLV